MPDLDEKIVVKNLIKIFDHHPQKAMKLLAEGKGKDEILEETGQTVRDGLN